MEITKKSKSNSLKSKFNPLNLLVGIILLIYTVTIIFVLYFILVSSFKDNVVENSFGLPIKDFTFDRIMDVFNAKIDRGGPGKPFSIVPDILINTVLYVVGASFLAALVPCIMAYAASKFDYRFNKVIYATVVVVMIVPVVGNMPSMVAVLDALNLYNTIWGGWIMRANFVNMYFLVFYAIFQGVPKDYSEAAYIDGASEFRVMFSIMMPLVKTTLFTVMIVQFVHIWNDYQTPLLYFPNKRTLATAVFNISNKADSTLPLKVASSFIMVIPTLIIFVCFRKKLMGNLTMGGIKG